METGKQAVGSGSQQEAGPDVCDLRCLRGTGECTRKICTSACKLTANIEMVEAEAEMPLLRDPAAEMPDDEADVVVVLRANDEGRGVTTGAHHAGHGWCETQDGQARGLIIRSDMIEGWCHHHEAAKALRKAVRHG